MGWDETLSITTRLSSDIAAAYGEIFWDGMRLYTYIRAAAQPLLTEKH